MGFLLPPTGKETPLPTQTSIAKKGRPQRQTRHRDSGAVMPPEKKIPDVPVSLPKPAKTGRTYPIKFTFFNTPCGIEKFDTSLLQLNATDNASLSKAWHPADCRRRLRHPHRRLPPPARTTHSLRLGIPPARGESGRNALSQKRKRPGFPLCGAPQSMRLRYPPRHFRLSRSDNVSSQPYYLLAVILHHRRQTLLRAQD